MFLMIITLKYSRSNVIPGAKLDLLAPKFYYVLLRKFSDDANVEKFSGFLRSKFSNNDYI